MLMLNVFQFSLHSVFACLSIVLLADRVSAMTDKSIRGTVVGV